MVMIQSCLHRILLIEIQKKTFKVTGSFKSDGDGISTSDGHGNGGSISDGDWGDEQDNTVSNGANAKMAPLNTIDSDPKKKHSK